MFGWERLVPLVLIFSSLASSRVLEKRQLTFGKCNTKITTANGLFEAAEEPLKSAVSSLNDGVKFLQSLCQSLPKACGALKANDVQNCITQAKKLSNGNLGAGLADKWNNLGAGGGLRQAEDSTKKQGGDSTKKQGGDSSKKQGGDSSKKQGGDSSKKQGGDSSKRQGRGRNRPAGQGSQPKN